MGTQINNLKKIKPLPNRRKSYMKPNITQLPGTSLQNIIPPLPVPLTLHPLIQTSTVMPDMTSAVIQEFRSLTCKNEQNDSNWLTSVSTIKRPGSLAIIFHFISRSCVRTSARFWPRQVFPPISFRGRVGQRGGASAVGLCEPIGKFPS